MKKIPFLTALLLLSASALHAQPAKKIEEPSAKLVGSGTGPITGFQEEPGQFEADSAGGKFTVIVERSAREARKLIHAERSKKLHGGRSLAVEQKEMAARIEKRTGKSDPYASVYIGITDDGILVGAYRYKGPGPLDHTVNQYNLDDKGTIKKIVLSGGTRSNTPALFVRMFDSSGAEKTWLVLTYIDTSVMKLDFDIKDPKPDHHIQVYDDEEPPPAKLK